MTGLDHANAATTAVTLAELDDEARNLRFRGLQDTDGARVGLDAARPR